MAVDPKIAIKKKYALQHTQLIRTRDADLRTLEVKRKGEIGKVEAKHKADVDERNHKFREDSLALNSAENDEIDALKP